MSKISKNRVKIAFVLRLKRFKGTPLVATCVYTRVVKFCQIILEMLTNVMFCQTKTKEEESFAISAKLTMSH